MRDFIWMLEVREKRKNGTWSPTGLNWHRLRKDVLKTKTEAEHTWRDWNLEYRVTKYVPERAK